MVELQVNVTDYVHQCYSFLRDKFEEFNCDLEDFFDELDDIKKCRVGKTSYKVGEMWQDENKKWYICASGGVIERKLNPCTLPDVLDQLELED